MARSMKQIKQISKFTVRPEIKLIATDKESHVTISQGGSSVHRL